MKMGGRIGRPLPRSELKTSVVSGDAERKESNRRKKRKHIGNHLWNWWRRKKKKKTRRGRRRVNSSRGESKGKEPRGEVCRQGRILDETTGTDRYDDPMGCVCVCMCVCVWWIDAGLYSDVQAKETSFCFTQSVRRCARGCDHGGHQGRIHQSGQCQVRQRTRGEGFYFDDRFVDKRASGRVFIEHELKMIGRTA